MANSKSFTDLRNKHARQPVLLLGNGPSLDLIDHGELTCLTIGINRSWRKLVSPYHCMLDSREYNAEIEQGRWKPKVLFRFDPTRRQHGVELPGLNLMVSTMTGLLAMQVAVFLGCNPIYLIGYDCGFGEAHFQTGDVNGPFCEANDPRINRTRSAWHFTEVARRLHAALPETKVYNLSPESSIEVFDKKPLSLAVRFDTV